MGLSRAQRFSLPTLNWLRFPGGDEDVDGDEPSPTWALEDVLDAAAGAGFAAVGLDAWTLAASDSDPGAMLSARGLACTDVGVLSLGNGDERRAAAALAETAAACGAEVCVAAFPSRVGADGARELRTAAEILMAAGARLALEFAPYSALRTLPEAIELCAATGWDRCGLLVDSLHFARSGAPWPLLRSLDGEQIALVHVNDAAAESDGDLRFESRFRRLPPGAGGLPLAELASTLDAIGYRGPLSAEVLSTELRALPVGEGARQLMEALRGWMD